MNSSLLKQVLSEYDMKRAKAVEEAESRKRELLEVNPKLQEIENELSKISIQAAKSVITADEEKKKKILADLKKRVKCFNKREKIIF